MTTKSAKKHSVTTRVETVCPRCGNWIEVELSAVSTPGKSLYIAGYASCECGARLTPYGFSDVQPLSQDNDTTQDTPDDTMFFVTVERDGRRGIFCTRDGNPFRKDGEPHTQEEMDRLLGPFWLVLDPRSEPFTEEEVAEYAFFCPLAEYEHQYGIALKEEDAPQRVARELQREGGDVDE